jgi:hypothetical protein
MLLRHDSTVFRCVACSSKLIHPLVEIAECRWLPLDAMHWNPACSKIVRD